MIRRTSLLAVCVLGGVFVFACSSSRGSGFGGDGSSGGASSSGAASSGGFGNNPEGGTPSAPCSPNPANYDIPGNNCDDDADGTVDNPPACDTGLAATGSAEDFAKALGICTSASDKGYGLVSATFTQGYQVTDAPHAEQHGILTKFGDVIKPRQGASLGVLSTGYAREFDGTGSEPFGGATKSGGGFGGGLAFNGKDWWGAVPGQGNGSAPPGFPKGAAGCQQDNQVNDVIDLKLTIKAPPNVSGVKFDFNFYSGEWPAYVCSPFNDGFIAYLNAKGFNGGKPDNMSFDSTNNPVSVNNGFFDRCTSNYQTGCASGKSAVAACPGGTGELGGTGFGVQGAWCSPFKGGSTAPSTNGGATGWLTSQAPVQGGETFTLEFMIWDAGDGVLDSSVLLDNFTWVQGAVDTSTDRPPK